MSVSEKDHAKIPNRLISEKSPYLLQHAYNPVDWHPWGEEAFEKARREEKPIFLSIGYSTCYWCHVMEREVFEDEAIAELMNKTVICIKVDREERPDVDRVYMSALQAMSGSGGWPMSMFLTPGLKPFFGATYIPPAERYGRPGFPQILKRIEEVWQGDRKQVLEAGDRIQGYLVEQSEREIGGTAPDAKALDAGFEYFNRTFDEKHGGFGGAPKFPRPSVLNFLFRYYKRTRNPRALEMALTTLRRMAGGGMYDHLGGGFHRYSTDGQWHVPHFEKMIYDQAQLAISYLEAFQITHDEAYSDTVRDILSYVRRDMMHADGGFFSAEDAESFVDHTSSAKKEEGAFHVWTKKEIDELLSEEESRAWCTVYGVGPMGNVADDPHGVFEGKNVFHVVTTTLEAAEKIGCPEAELEARLVSSRTKLFRARLKRPKPHLDDKILTSWNGLMISAFARTHQVLGDRSYLEAAEKAAGFVLGHLRDKSTGELLHRYRDGEARFEANLDDYALIVQALIDLYETNFDINLLKEAIALTKLSLGLFHDSDAGGLFDTTGRDRSLLLRTKEWYDGAEPSGNAVATLNLLRLSQLTNEVAFSSTAQQSLVFFGERLQSSPHAMPQFLSALDYSLARPVQIIIAGSAVQPETQALLRAIQSRYLPNRVMMLADGGEGQEFLAAFVPYLSTVRMIDGLPTAYICENFACKLPTTSPQEALRLLAAHSA